MTAVTLDDLVSEAVLLAGGSVCGEHDWQSAGGRACPRNPYANASQTVYRCRCGVYDYGEPGGPGHRECFIEGPCDPSCRWADYAHNPDCPAFEHPHGECNCGF